MEGSTYREAEGKQSDYHRNLHTELPLLSVFKVIFKMAFFFFKIRITPSVTERLIYVSANILGWVGEPSTVVVFGWCLQLHELHCLLCVGVGRGVLPGCWTVVIRATRKAPQKHRYAGFSYLGFPFHSSSLLVLFLHLWVVFFLFVTRDSRFLFPSILSRRWEERELAEHGRGRQTFVPMTSYFQSAARRLRVSLWT